MADTTLSPNMSLVVPTVGEDPGPNWANDVNASLAIIDQHNHTAGSGVLITPDAISMTTDLPFNQKNATQLRSVRFYPQTSTLAEVTDLGILYENGVDLYYVDGNGNQIRITQSGTVTGATGTITGLPSGTASASFSAGTFTFQSATSTPAAMRFGPIQIGEQVASPQFVTIQSPASLAASYTLKLPTALPVGVRFMTLDNTGAIAVNSTVSTGTGAVVLATSPTIASPVLNSPTIASPTLSGTAGGSLTSLALVSPVFSGSPTGVITNNTFAPTYVWSASVTLNSESWMYIRIGDIVFVTGTFSVTSGGSIATLISISVPVNTGSSVFAGLATSSTGIQGATVTQVSFNTFTSSIVSINSSTTRSFSFTYSYVIV